MDKIEYNEIKQMWIDKLTRAYMDYNIYELKDKECWELVNFLKDSEMKR